MLLVLVVWRWRGRWSLRLAAWVAAPPLLITGWWFARNLFTFGRLTPPLSPITTQNQYLGHFGQLRGFVSESARSVAGPETTTGLVARGSPAIAMTWLLAGAFVLLALVAAHQAFRRRRAMDADSRLAVVAATAVVAVTGAAYLANSVLVDLQPQVRYPVVAVGTAAAACAWTLTGIVSRMRCRFVPPLVALAGALVLALDIDTLRVPATQG